MDTNTTRRAMFGCAGLAAVALAIPAIAVLPTGNRHGAWLAERTRLMARANAVDCHSEAFDQACNGMTFFERQILHTPAANVAEARAKLRFTSILYAEGSMLGADDTSDLLAEITPFLDPEA